MRSLLAMCAVLTACGGVPDGSRPLTAREAEIAAEVGCDDPETRITVTSDSELFQRRTSYCPPPPEPGMCSADSYLVQSGQCRWGCAHGAYVQYRDEPWPVLLWSDWHPHPVLWGPSYSEGLLRHELGHCAHGRAHGHEEGQ